ncbi:hypothetical protein Y032_0014g2298 [Ancylostoma ceylanicum]|uniref:Uncharacterized protein n=1 Tax=Ancylostoma ceylanicum TaxID=53326 RepID=A0A016V9Z7_9BILA|nr:hypothetical protein Y032_0014g2298 [Ancylostoma ceylanicum]
MVSHRLIVLFCRPKQTRAFATGQPASQPPTLAEWVGEVVVVAVVVQTDVGGGLSGCQNGRSIDLPYHFDVKYESFDSSSASNSHFFLRISHHTAVSFSVIALILLP